MTPPAFPDPPLADDDSAQPGSQGVIATEVLREALASDEVTVTIVPVIRSVGPKSGYDDDIVKLEAVRIITYR